MSSLDLNKAEAINCFQLGEKAAQGIYSDLGVPREIMAECIRVINQIESRVTEMTSRLHPP